MNIHYIYTPLILPWAKILAILQCDFHDPIVNLLSIIRGLVRTGATGASAPSEILQRVRRTRPENRELILKTINCKKNALNM